MAILNMAVHTIPTSPSSGTLHTFPNTFDKSLYTLDDAGTLNRLDSSLFSIAAAVTVVANATTLVVGGTGTTAKFPANAVKIGTSLRVTMLGSFTGTVTVTAFRIHYGPLGTTADPVILTASVTGAVGTALAKVTMDLTFRTIGAAATNSGFLEIIQHGAVAVGVANSAGGLTIVQGTSSAANTTVDSYITVSILTAASGSSGTIQNATIERI